MEKHYIKLLILSIRQIVMFIKEIRAIHEQGKSVVIYCRAGMGRTGAMLALWLVVAQGMNTQDAITMVRQLRPGSIETELQENLIIDIFKIIHSIAKNF